MSAHCDSNESCFRHNWNISIRHFPFAEGVLPIAQGHELISIGRIYQSSLQSRFVGLQSAALDL